MPTGMEKKKLVFSPEGSHLLVDDIVSELTLEHRAEKAGLALIVEHENRPRNTMGTIVALGDDPYFYEQVIVQGRKRQRWQVGDIVTFAWHAGAAQLIEGHEFRSIIWQDIIGTFREDRDLELPQPQAPSDEPAQGARNEQCLGSELPADLSGTSCRES